jgi:CheY-like chemotaxis protein
MKKILWFDNDLVYIKPFIKSLQKKGYSIDRVSKLTEAGEKLQTGTYDLLILDSMITTLDDEEEIEYPPEQTNRGLNTGVCFFSKWKNILAEKNTEVLALTVRMDPDVKQSFINAGLTEENFARKVELRTIPTFFQKIQNLLKEKEAAVS